MSHTLIMGGVITYQSTYIQTNKQEYYSNKSTHYDPNVTIHSARSETPQGLIGEELPIRHRVSLISGMTELVKDSFEMTCRMRHSFEFSSCF